MESDCKVLLDVEEGLMSPAKLTVLRETSTHSGRWKMWGALLAMALCVSAALLITCHKKDGSIEQPDDLRHTLRQVSGIKDAIHLEGYYNSSYSNSTVQWSDEVDQGFHQGNLKLVNNEIVIKSTGLYFVYSQVSFKVSCQAQQMVHLSHGIRRRTNSYGNQDDDDETLYLPLLHSMRTVCGGVAGNEGNAFTAVYMGAVFHMKDGDRLKTDTESRHVPHLQDESGKNFFGVFAL